MLTATQVSRKSTVVPFADSFVQAPASSACQIKHSTAPRRGCSSNEFEHVPEHNRLAAEVACVREYLHARYGLANFVTKSSQIQEIFELAARIADTTSTVLIEGETGTGKEQVARAIHIASRKRNGPLVAVACAALPEQLLETELFGHEKGAFTSATGQRKGRFELAHGGTLFLDEIGDLPASMQAKLLRVLQERSFERVGGTQSIPVDVRVIAATNRCLLSMVQSGTFRADLYYRLNVVKIDLPALRERLADIPLLAVHFVAKYARPGTAPKTIAAACWNLLLRYRWPGNIRELENAIERACVASAGEFVRPEDLPTEITTPTRSKTGGHLDWSSPLPELIKTATAKIERRYIRRALKRSYGNIGRCAKLCGISRRSISSKLAKYQIDRSSTQNDCATSFDSGKTVLR